MKKLKSSFVLDPTESSLISQFIQKDIPVYSDEDKFVWEKMVKNIISAFDKYARFVYPPFEEGFRNLGLNNIFIPDLETINKKLALIGWQAFYVTGFVPAGIYALMLANQIFPISATLRPLKYFNYSAAPDFAHDVLGHLPMLFVKDFRELLRNWAIKTAQCKITYLDEETYRLTAALIKEKEQNNHNVAKIRALTQNLNNVYEQLNNNPSELSVLAKFYGWSFEFGVIKSNGVPKIFGAAIISSSKETENVCKGKARIMEFNETTLKAGINYTSLQGEIFYATNFKTYNHFLDQINIANNELYI